MNKKSTTINSFFNDQHQDSTKKHEYKGTTETCFNPSITIRIVLAKVESHHFHSTYLFLREFLSTYLTAQYNK
jgi:hypothetical protein